MDELTNSKAKKNKEANLLWKAYSLELAKRIKALRNKRNISQEALSASTCLSRNVIARIEAYVNNPEGQANVVNTNLHSLALLAQALEVPLAELLPDDNLMPRLEDVRNIHYR
ncbi:MAG: helix-turn-helix transcriptional regulator [Micrococcaceae bacterium]